MSSWQKLESKVLNEIQRDQLESKKDDGVTVELAVSPYDLPIAVRGAFDKPKRRFVIEFKYIDQEDWSLQRSDEFIDLRIGKNSGRLYGIEIDADSLKADEVVLRVEARQHVNKALTELVSAPVKARRKVGNYKAVESILRRKPDLFAPLEYEVA
jgi:hypothetical protein